ncbi:MAG TPA: response regulator [Candidatus Binatia bacterium]|nr:response regulator [Candidatus Binatia bacterium]
MQEHSVRFYDDGPSLVSQIVDFLQEGFRARASAIVIATAEHRAELTRALAGRPAAGWAGRVRMLDAADTLAEICVDGVPDAQRFEAVIGGAIAQASQGGRPVRAFGEMVALLWADGRRDAAMRLEQMWNDLATRHPFALLCAYRLDAFQCTEDREDFRRVCDLHTHIHPLDGGRLTDVIGLRRQLAEMQQRACALETEIVRRRNAEAEESRLREELTGRLRELAASDAAKDELLAVLSHELRNPLSPITTALAMTHLTDDPQVWRSARDVIERQATRLQELVEELLDSARRQMGRLGAGDGVRRSVAERARAPAAPATPRRVLLVDDHADAAASLGEVLRAHGHEVAAVTDPCEALGAASQLQPDTIVLDIDMPGVDGYELAQRLRASPLKARLIALTGAADASHHARIVDAGFDHHLVKPVDLHELRRMMEA